MPPGKKDASFGKMLAISDDRVDGQNPAPVDIVSKCRCIPQFAVFEPLQEFVHQPCHFLFTLLVGPPFVQSKPCKTTVLQVGVK